MMVKPALITMRIPMQSQAQVSAAAYAQACVAPSEVGCLDDPRPPRVATSKSKPLEGALTLSNQGS